MPDLTILFAKAPIPGRVKTRLTPELSADVAAEVYEACLRDVYDRLATLPTDRAVFFDPAEGAAAYFEKTFPDARLHAQAGTDLGERMEAAFSWAFAEGAERVSIVGGDSPTLPRRLLEDAREALAEVDAVLGPTTDGGYFLVGIRAAAWPRAGALFRRIPWSTQSVLRTTLERAAAAGVAVRTIGEWYDIDRPEDLHRAAADAEPGSRLADVLGRVFPADARPTDPGPAGGGS